jgi:hypothetical protein
MFMWKINIFPERDGVVLYANFPIRSIIKIPSNELSALFFVTLIFFKNT